MDITRTTDYAIRAVIFLANQKGDRPVPAATIAREQEIPDIYVSKVLQALARSGLVVTRAGRSGGAMLQRKPEDISLLDIIEAMEGPVYLNRCMVRSRACSRDKHCPMHPFWKDLQKTLTDRLRHATIDQFVAQDSEEGEPPAKGTP